VVHLLNRKTKPTELKRELVVEDWGETGKGGRSKGMRGGKLGRGRNGRRKRKQKKGKEKDGGRGGAACRGKEAVCMEANIRGSMKTVYGQLLDIFLK
jgi:hypothetical protein